MRTIRFPIVFVLLLLMISLTGCKMGANEEFIQGQWQFEVEHLKNLPAEPHLTMIWAFDGGYFYYDGCCFNQDSNLKGNYRILREEGNVLTLELYNVVGTETGIGGELRIEIDPATDSLTIINAGPYLRMTRKYGGEG